MESLEPNGGPSSYPKTPPQHFNIKSQLHETSHQKTRHQNYINSNIIKSELPNHFMRDFNIIIDHRQNSSTVTTLRSKPKYVYQKFIPEFVLSLLFGIKLVLFMFFYRLSNSLMPISFGTLLTMFYYLFNCFTLLSLFRP
jgi:glycerol uptake facilitator-like aquaporin